MSLQERLTGREKVLRRSEHSTPYESLFSAQAVTQLLQFGRWEVVGAPDCNYFPRCSTKTFDISDGVNKNTISAIYVLVH